MKKRNAISQAAFIDLCDALRRDLDLLKAAPPRCVATIADRYAKELKIPITPSAMERALEKVGLTTSRQASRRAGKAGKPEQQPVTPRPPQAPQQPVQASPQEDRARMTNSEWRAHWERIQEERYAEFRILQAKVNSLWNNPEFWKERDKLK